MSKSIARLLCLVMVLILAVPAFAFAEEKTQITFMCFDENRGSIINEKIKEIVADFNANNTYNVEIVPEYIASEQAKTKLPTLMAANAAPDIFNTYAAGFLQPYVEAGKVYCLDDAFTADPEWKDSFKAGALDTLTYGGKVYGVPTRFELWGMYYNKTIYERCGVELPNTWEELVEGLKIIKEKEPETVLIAYGNKDAWPIASLCEVLSNRAGGQEKFEKAAAGELSWADESFVKGAALIKELMDEGLIDAGVNGFPVEEGHAQFKSGNAAVLSYLTSMSEIFADANITMDEVEFRNVPMIAGGEGDPGMWLGQVGINYAISETCANKEAAVAFLKALIGGTQQVVIEDNSGIPAYRSDLLDLTNASTMINNLMAEMDQMTGMFVFYDVVLGSVLGNEYNGTIQSVVGGADPQEALEAYDQFFQENMDF